MNKTTKILILSLTLLILISGCTRSGDGQPPNQNGTIGSFGGSSDSSCPAFSDLRLHYGDDSSFTFLENGRPAPFVNVTKYCIDDYKAEYYEGYQLHKGAYAYDGGCFTFCHKGSALGESTNYFYCGKPMDNGRALTAIKNILDDNGVVKDKIEKKITLVFDSDKKYVKTICE